MISPRDSNGDKLADELLFEAKGLKEATVTSMLNEITFLKRIIWMLGVAILILILGVGTLCYRTFFVTGPKVDRTDEAVREIKKTNLAIGDVQKVVDSMNAFVDKVKKEQDPQLQAELVKAIFDIRKALCNHDPKSCSEAGIVSSAPPTTISPPTTDTTSPESDTEP